MAYKKLKDYSKGKIYKIEPICDFNEGEIYIGSTTKSNLSQRMENHRKNYMYHKNKYLSSFILFDKYGIDNCEIILLENVNANDYNELVTREAYYIKTLKCINKVIPLRTRKEYYEDHRETFIMKEKEYREANKEKITARRKEYCKRKYNCECGTVCNLNTRSSHFKTLKHQNYLKQLETIN